MHVLDRSQFQIGIPSDPNVAVFTSVLLPFLCLTGLIYCLASIKRAVSCFFRRKASKTVQCQRVSTISGSESATVQFPRSIKVQDFGQHFQGLASDSYYKLSEEFEDLKVDEPPATAAAEIAINRLKNRFVNILPYDNTRFLLAPKEDVEGSDYINANYVSGFSSSKEFLCTQGPLKSTTADFWRMCWEANTKTIVMLTKCVDKDKEKCYHYWPNGHFPEQYGEIEVEVTKEMLKSYACHNWIITEMRLRREGEERSIKHFQFLTWPDFGAVEPVESLIDFIRTVRTYEPYVNNRNEDGVVPIVIHCSAGVGRSGTFIAVDIAMQKLQAYNAVDIFEIVYKMRRERVWMVQTEQQYICIYKCVLSIINTMEALKAEMSQKDEATDEDNGSDVSVDEDLPQS